MTLFEGDKGDEDEKIVKSKGAVKRQVSACNDSKFVIIFIERSNGSKL